MTRRKFAARFFDTTDNAFDTPGFFLACSLVVLFGFTGYDLVALEHPFAPISFGAAVTAIAGAFAGCGALQRCKDAPEQSQEEEKPCQS